MGVAQSISGGAINIVHGLRALPQTVLWDVTKFPLDFESIIGTINYPFGS